MLRFALSILVFTPLLLSCGSARQVQPHPHLQPQYPTLQAAHPAVLEPTYTENMLNFLSGKLPEQMNFAPLTSSAPLNTK